LEISAGGKISGKIKKRTEKPIARTRKRVAGHDGGELANLGEITLKRV